MKLLSRNKLNTLVEAVGLVISFTVFIVLMSQVWYDVTFDRSYPGSGSKGLRAVQGIRRLTRFS